MPEVNVTQMRDAVAWATNDRRSEEDTSTNPWEWFWQAIQGDFNDNRTTGQIVVDAAISMIPLVDQVCDARDLIANCKKLREDPSNTWTWVALVLTLVGLIPVLGSFVKGVLKVFFAFVCRTGGIAITKAVDGAMTWVITLLRRQTFQAYLKLHKIDDVFNWLADEVKAIHGRVSTEELLKVFDRAIDTLNTLAAKVDHIPLMGERARRTVENVVWVRAMAATRLEQVKPIIDPIFHAITLRLRNEALNIRGGIVNVNNIHYRGALPESNAVTLMRRTKPRPSWLKEGADVTWKKARPASWRDAVEVKVKDGWPSLSDQGIESFHKLLAVEIKGPARLYRIVSPNSRAMSDCWISEKIFNEIRNSPDPRAVWRKYFAVWPDWNVNGQFVVYDVKPGETLKVWKGPASSQVKEGLPDVHLEGGGEQIVFNIARTDPKNDLVRYYKLKGGQKNKLQGAISQSDFDKLGHAERQEYLAIRESINHPNISGPFETGWGYTDFGGQGFPDKIGLPSFDGQLTSIR